ncbi:MAG: type II toxin-antitoxin system VapC family toxin [Acidobacteriota bacterium]
MVVIDANILLLLLRPGTPVPVGANGVPIERPRDRIDKFVNDIDATGSKIIIPTPALSEALVHAGAAASQQIVEYLQRYSVFRIEPFDARAAIELAAMTRGAIAKGSKKAGSIATWAKLKFDRQIVAIAKVCGATEIYSDDVDLQTTARASNINVLGLADMPLPADSPQLDFLSGLSAAKPETGDTGVGKQASDDPQPKE